MSSLNPIHPGEILREDFFISIDNPRGYFLKEMSQKTGISTEELTLLMDETTDITPEIAEKLSKGFSTSKEFWLNLQHRYNQDKEEQPCTI